MIKNMISKFYHKIISQYSGNLNRENIVDISLKFLVMCFDLQYFHYNISPLILPSKKKVSGSKT